MKLLFDKLKTSDGIVRVSFDGEVTWNEYNVADVKNTGITFTEDDCPDLTKIRIAGAITKISDIKTHIVNESISQDLTTDEQIESLRQQDANIINRFENYQYSKAQVKNMLWVPDPDNNIAIYPNGYVSTYTLSIPTNRKIRFMSGNTYIAPENFNDYSNDIKTNISNIGAIGTWTEALNSSLFTEDIVLGAFEYQLGGYYNISFSNNVLKQFMNKFNNSFTITNENSSATTVEVTLSGEELYSHIKPGETSDLQVFSNDYSYYFCLDGFFQLIYNLINNTDSLDRNIIREQLVNLSITSYQTTSDVYSYGDNNQVFKYYNFQFANTLQLSDDGLIDYINDNRAEVGGESPIISFYKELLLIYFDSVPFEQILYHYFTTFDSNIITENIGRLMTLRELSTISVSESLLSTMLPIITKRVEDDNIILTKFTINSDSSSIQYKEIEY